MAEIQVLGQVEQELVLQKSCKDTVYVCFNLKEQARKGRTQSYQVWAWGEDASRLKRKKVGKGSLIWLTGTMELVDCTSNQGKDQVKLLKVYLSNWGFLPSQHTKGSFGAAKQEPEISTPVPTPDRVLDGDREFLPE